MPADRLLAAQHTAHCALGGGPCLPASCVVFLHETNCHCRVAAVQAATSADNITVAALGSATDDEARLAALGYKQQLKRDLSLFTNFALSFTIVSILTGLTGEQQGVGVQLMSPPRSCSLPQRCWCASWGCNCMALSAGVVRGNGLCVCSAAVSGSNVDQRCVHPGTDHRTLR